jgi:transposase-like protein
MFERERTKPYVIRYALYLYFLGLSLRSTSRTIQPFVDRSYAAIWYWIQEFDPKYVYPNKKKKSRITAAFIIIDETQIQIGSNEAWLWVAIEPTIHRTILEVYISRHRNMIYSSRIISQIPC